MLPGGRPGVQRSSPLPNNRATGARVTGAPASDILPKVHRTTGRTILACPIYKCEALQLGELIMPIAAPSGAQFGRRKPPTAAPKLAVKFRLGSSMSISSTMSRPSHSSCWIRTGAMTQAAALPSAASEGSTSTLPFSTLFKESSGGRAKPAEGTSRSDAVLSARHSAAARERSLARGSGPQSWPASSARKVRYR